MSKKFRVEPYDNTLTYMSLHTGCTSLVLRDYIENKHLHSWLDTKDATISESLSQISPEIRPILERLQREALVPLSALGAELAEYTSELREQAQRTEFFDLETAKKTAELCRKLLAALPVEPGQSQHRLIQVAIRYFILDEDAEDDNDSLIGFDDDLQVVLAVISELGLNYLIEDNATDG